MRNCTSKVLTSTMKKRDGGGLQASNSDTNHKKSWFSSEFPVLIVRGTILKNIQPSSVILKAYRVLCLFRFPGFRLVRIRWGGSRWFDLPRLLLWLHVRFRFFVRFRIVIRFRLFIMVTWRFWYLIRFFIPTFGFPILAGRAPKKEIEEG